MSEEILEVFRGRQAENGVKISPERRQKFNFFHPKAYKITNEVNNTMNIVIVGCGKVGRTLAEKLNEEGNNIVVIDSDAQKVKNIAEKLDIMGVIGNGATHSVQAEAGIEDADLFIAVTGSDEMNLLCCLIAKKAGNCQTIARIKNPQYSSDAKYFRDELGLAMVINTEYAAAEEIARILRFPSALKIDTFAGGKVELIKFKIPDNSPIVGISVKEMIMKLRCDVLVCTVERNGEAYIANGDFVFAEKDVISVIASHKNANEFFKKIDMDCISVKDTMIAGGGEIGQYLTEILLKYGIEVKIIDKHIDRCNELSSRWSNVEIIYGNTTDRSVLLEEGLKKTDSFVSLLAFDEENILLSLYARSVNSGKIITKINEIDFDDVINKLDLDTIINPKSITADEILRFVRSMKNSMGSNVETLYSVINGKVEAAEFTVKENSPIIGKPLMQLNFKPDVLIAAIIRDKKARIPRGHDVIMPNDSVVVVSKLMGLHDISDILK